MILVDHSNLKLTRRICNLWASWQWILWNELSRGPDDEHG